MSNIINHVAFIMDGNGRWATEKNKPRTAGHKKGFEVLKKIIELSYENNIKEISFFTFSTENWNRPKQEVKYLMKLIDSFLNKKNANKINENNIKFRIIGFENNVPEKTIKKAQELTVLTKNNSKLIVNIYFNYGGINDIVNAVNQILKTKIKSVDKNQFKAYLLTKDVTPIDLLIRTSGEKRISNFDLFNLSYSEIIFEKTKWPDYNEKIFLENLNEYKNRDRRYGTIKH